jgi:hypothetical protein
MDVLWVVHLFVRWCMRGMLVILLSMLSWIVLWDLLRAPVLQRTSKGMLLDDPIKSTCSTGGELRETDELEQRNITSVVIQVNLPKTGWVTIT